MPQNLRFKSFGKLYPCRLLAGYWSFERKYCVYLQGQTFKKSFNFLDSLTIKTETLRALELPLYRRNIPKTEICIYTLWEARILNCSKIISHTEDLAEDKRLGRAGLAKRTKWVEAIFFSVMSSREKTSMVTMAEKKVTLLRISSLIRLGSCNSWSLACFLSSKFCNNFVKPCWWSFSRNELWSLYMKMWYGL